MSRVLEYFEIISKTPRCSFKADKMRDKIIEISKDLGFEVISDSVGNILAKKGNPRITLQAHYDMVCLGEVDNIELITQGNTLKAKNSTLGADNGMGMAIMFACMEKYDDIECLFTSDEEVGLIGASNLELELSSNKLLNLDGEDESEIYVGCAGGVDIISTMKLSYEPLSDEKIYEVSVIDLPGGHSGVDIDKNIPSATKVLAKELVKFDFKLLHVSGGEFRNSISKNAKAIIATSEVPHIDNSLVNVQECEYKREYIKNGDIIIKALAGFAQGVRSFDKEFNIPSTSINLGVVKIEEGVLRIACAARAMKDIDLDELADESEAYFQIAGFETVQSDKHYPWVPNVGSFANKVHQSVQKRDKNAVLKAIHAGLECGVLIQSQKHEIEAVAIGPNIRFPHSLREECDLDSVARITQVVEEIIEG